MHKYTISINQRTRMLLTRTRTYLDTVQVKYVPLLNT